MKNPVLILFLLTLIVSCSSPENKEGISQDSLKKTEESASRDQPASIPQFPALDLDNQWLDSTRSYGAGDCFGNIYRYTKEGNFYAADSLVCGEYGFTFTHYLLDSAGFLLMVRELKWESIINDTGDDYSHLLSEHVYDFQREPALTYFRTDTLQEHYISAGFPVRVQNPFNRQSLELKESIYESLMFRYQKPWYR